MGVLDNTIIVYTTDNGPEHSAKNHGGTTPFRGEKMTTCEGGTRVISMLRWVWLHQTRAGAKRHPGTSGHGH